MGSHGSTLLLFCGCPLPSQADPPTVHVMLWLYSSIALLKCHRWLDWSHVLSLLISHISPTVVSPGSSIAQLARSTRHALLVCPSSCREGFLWLPKHVQGMHPCHTHNNNLGSFHSFSFLIVSLIVHAPFTDRHRGALPSCCARDTPMVTLWCIHHFFDTLSGHGNSWADLNCFVRAPLAKFDQPNKSSHGSPGVPNRQRSIGALTPRLHVGVRHDVQISQHKSLYYQWQENIIIC